MNEEKQKNSYLSKVEDFVTSQLTGELWRFGRGIVQLSSAVAYGAVGTAVAALAFAGVSIFRGKSIEKQTKKGLLELYKQEISSITHKPIDKLDITDVDVAASYAPNGKKNAIALGLEAVHKNNKISMATSIMGIVGVSVLVAVAASILPSALLSGAGFMVANVVFGLASNVTFLTADHVVSKMNGGKSSYNFNAEMKELANQSRFSELKSEQVFDLLLKAHSEIENEIKNKYSKPYFALPIAIKSEVVGNYEEKLGAKRLTEKINRAEMNVQELGFIAYGSSSGNVIKQPQKQEVSSALFLDVPSSKHVSQLEQQRMILSESRTLH